MTTLAPLELDTSAEITPEDLLEFSDGDSYELVDGHPVEKNVSRESSNVELRFGTKFQNHVNDHPPGSDPIAEVYPGTMGFRCFPDRPGLVRRPDASVVRYERLLTLDDPDPGFMPIVPDLAVEVISPNDLSRDIDAKVREYLGAGFPLVWVANPVTRMIAVYPNGADAYLLSAHHEIAAENALPGFRCKVGDFFPPATPA